MSRKISVKGLLQSILPPRARSRMGIPLSDWESQIKNGDVESIASHIFENYGYSGDLLNIFTEARGKIVHKWHHYIPLYDRYFSKYRGKAVRILEIGVAGGGSLAMWRKYFGEDAIIYGIDLDPSCAVHNDQEGQVRIGSQANSAFLRSVVAEMGGVDIVLDDGSHVMRHIKTSLLNLFPLLSEGGTYFIEDLHTCFWREYGGAYESKSSVFCMVHELINDLHHWYHDYGFLRPEIGPYLSGIHVHDSILVLDKSSSCPPVHSSIS